MLTQSLLSSRFEFVKQPSPIPQKNHVVNDTLVELLLADIAYGYGVIPIMYQKPNYKPIMLPSDGDGLRLKAGEKLVFLANIEGLRRIEQGQLNLELKCWQIRIEKALTPDAFFEGANILARISGCSLSQARKTMENLPQTLPTFLYKHQAQDLIQELKKTLIISRLSSQDIT